MVLVLLGFVIFSVLMGRNLSSYVKQNLVVTVMFEQDMTNSEAVQMCKTLKARPFVNNLNYISKERALKEATRDLGANPSEFAGVNPFQPSIEITTKADYANNDSLKWISKELKAYPRVTEVSYQHDLIEKVNESLAKISLGLLIVAVLLTFISFSLINNTVRLGIYARRFSIHTMKLVGASFLSHFRLRQEFIHFSSEESQLPDERRTDAAVARIGKKKNSLHATQLLVDVSLLTLILEILGASYASH